MGDVIDYSYEVTNTGNVLISGPITVSDDMATDESCPTGDLSPGDSMTCTASYTITQADLNAGSVTNVASASGTDTNGNPVTSPTDTETVTAIQNPSIYLEKTAVPEIYSYPGQIIEYTLVATNDGNVDLHDVSITDPKLGTLTCTPSQPTQLDVGKSFTCIGSYTIQSSDVLDDITGTVQNTATANGLGPQDQQVSNTAQAEVTQVEPTGQITPTDTSCSDFRDGTSGDLTDLFYGVKNGKINNVAPGVMFYYSEITAPSESFEIVVQQTNTNGWSPIEIQKIGQVILWNNACEKGKTVTPTFDPTTGTVTIAVNGATAGDLCYLSIKYDPASLKGTSVSEPYPTVTYTFVSYLDGVEIIPSWDSVTVNPK